MKVIIIVHTIVPSSLPTHPFWFFWGFFFSSSQNTTRVLVKHSHQQINTSLFILRAMLVCFSEYFMETLKADKSADSHSHGCDICQSDRDLPPGHQIHSTADPRKLTVSLHKHMCCYRNLHRHSLGSSAVKRAVNKNSEQEKKDELAILLLETVPPQANCS